LDPAGIREVRSYIRRMAEEDGVAVIVSSHILSEMEMMCDRIGIIKNGELIAIQSVADTLQETDQKEVSIEASPVEQAQEFLQERLESSITLQNDKTLTFKLKREEIPQIISGLVAAGVDIYSVNVNRSTLEDKFLDLIGENSIE